MKSNLDPEGLFDPRKRFAFTNITEEVFTSKWDGTPIVVQPGETIEISNATPIPGAGHAIAVKMTCEMVDKIMIGEAKEDELQHKEPYYRSPKGSSIGVPAARALWEEKILRELNVDEESPTVQAMRKQLREELSTEHKPSTEPPPSFTSEDQFALVNAKEVKEEKKAVKTKKI